MQSTLSLPHLPKRRELGTTAWAPEDATKGVLAEMCNSTAGSVWTLHDRCHHGVSLARPCHRSRHHQLTMTAIFEFRITRPRDRPLPESPRPKVKKHHTKVPSQKLSVSSFMSARCDVRNGKITVRNYGTILSYSITPRVDFANTDLCKFMPDHRQKSVHSASSIDLRPHSRILRIAPVLESLAYSGLSQRLLSS